MLLRISLILAVLVDVNCFVVQTQPALKKSATKSCQPFVRSSAFHHKRSQILPRMAMDEDELDRKLRELAAERKQSLDAVFVDSDKSKKRIEEARTAKIEADSADKARVSGSAEAASRGSKSENIVNSPSFLEQAVSSGQQQDRERAAAASQARPKPAVDSVEIDPRGFIVPKVGTLQPFPRTKTIASLLQSFVRFPKDVACTFCRSSLPTCWHP